MATTTFSAIEHVFQLKKIGAEQNPVNSKKTFFKDWMSQFFQQT